MIATGNDIEDVELLRLFFGKNLLEIMARLSFFNWDSLYARLNSHCKAWSYKKKMHKKIKAYRKSL